MGKPKRFLDLSIPLVGLECARFRFEVCAGRWTVPMEDGESECVVIVQERMQGPLKSSGVFKMAIDPVAVESVIEGLQKWLEYDEAGRLGELFKGGVPRSDKRPG